MGTITEMSVVLGVAAVCAAVGVARATYYRRLKPRQARPRAVPPRKLGEEERRAVLAVLHEPRFADLAPIEVYATLLDEGRYLCSERTMYRVLAENSEVRERRNQLRHPRYSPPELLAMEGPERFTGGCQNCAYPTSPFIRLLPSPSPCQRGI
jgi:putative transposase